MLRHPPLIEKDTEDISPFWTGIAEFITPYIDTRDSVSVFIQEIKDGEITDVTPYEFYAVQQKLTDLYRDQKLDVITVSYNIFLGMKHYEKVIKKIVSPCVLNV